MAKVLKRKSKFKNKYVLGRGRPWGYGLTDNICSVGVNTKTKDGYSGQIKLDWPHELWAMNTPEYEIILRRVK